MAVQDRTAFRKRLLAREPLIGTFVKTPHPSVVEVLALTDLDCVCIDTEHVPFDRAQLDVAVLAARAGAMPCLVRTRDASASEILNALDLGADGVVLPHIRSAADARAASLASRYAPGGRGYAGSTRAAGYTTRKMPDIIAGANASVAVVAQIEDAEALDCIDDIAAVEGIDALFVGRMDLTVSLGAQTSNDARVVDAVAAICAAGRNHGRAVGMFVANVEEVPQWKAQGATLFILASDHNWILAGARELVASFRRD